MALTERPEVSVLRIASGGACSIQRGEDRLFLGQVFRDAFAHELASPYRLREVGGGVDARPRFLRRRATEEARLHHGSLVLGDPVEGGLERGVSPGLQPDGAPRLGEGLGDPASHDARADHGHGPNLLSLDHLAAPFGFR